MAQITEDYVSFEIAKLLKEKGFDVYVRSFYEKDEYKTKEEFSTNNALWNWNISSFRYSAPTLQMAMKWLREVHYIHISPFIKSITRWGVQIFNSRKAHTLGCKPLEIPSLMRLWANSYEEACEAAIKYCLEKLV